MTEEGQANGWEFWDKVYTNKDLRKTINEQAQINEISMSELLRSTHLARAQIIVQNVPRLSPTHIVQNLIKRDMKLDVLSTRGRLPGPQGDGWTRLQRKYVAFDAPRSEYGGGCHSDGH